MVQHDNDIQRVLESWWAITTEKYQTEVQTKDVNK